MITNNAILVYTDGGVVKHRFCQEIEARVILADISDKMEAVSLFVVDHMEAKLVYDVSPDLRDRVAAAKTKHKAQARIKMALDRHGVPQDRDLRIAIFNAFDDLTSP